MDSFGDVILVVIVVVGFALMALVAVIKRLTCIAGPNEVLVFSGRMHSDPSSGIRRGYGVAKGGRRLRIPLLEVVDTLDLTNMIVPVAVQNAFSKGGIPLSVESVANVKIAGEMPLLSNAIERLLGKSRADVKRIAQETLEGNLRGVLATMTPEELNEDRERFEQGLIDEADDDLRGLGLVLDTLKIQNISDDRGFLDSIGRKKNAEIQKAARIAEAQNQAMSTVRAAKNWQDTEVARIEAEVRTLQAQTERKVAEALSRKKAVVAEQQGEVAALLAAALAELEVQKHRVEQVRRQLQADVVEPAEAQRSQSIAQAKGEAAKVTENGRARAAALEQVIESWHHAGAGARDVFLLQKLEHLTQMATSTIKHVAVDKVTVLPKGHGGELATQLVSAAEQIKSALGIDVVEAVQQRLGPGNGRRAPSFRPPPPPPRPSAPPK
jgi:flotillin